MNLSSIINKNGSTEKMETVSTDDPHSLA